MTLCCLCANVVNNISRNFDLLRTVTNQILQYKQIALELSL
jgi:hypothetical protein